MRHSVRTLVLLALSAAPLAAQPEIDNVAAFARVYGVARWFYPSDAAATLDWNRFAVLGVSRVRGARTPAELQRALQELFAPLGPGIEIGTSLSAAPAPGMRDPTLVAWSYRGAGIATNIRGPYGMKRTNRVPVMRGTSGPGILMQSIRADTLRGRTVRMRGRLRVASGASTNGYAALWLRVDRAPQVLGYFDNMGDRPVRDTAWHEYVIEGPVADDASSIAFGALAVGGATVDVDLIELETKTSEGKWTPLAIVDSSFEASGNPRTWNQNWDAYAFVREKAGAAHGSHFMRMSPVPPKVGVADKPVDSLETPVRGATVDVEVGRGLRARLPLSLTDAQATEPAREPAPLAALRKALAAVGNPVQRDDADLRLADVVVAWSMFRHFYPYFGDIGLDWDARLQPQLRVALDAAASREGHLDALRALVADLRDGHGNVYDAAFPAVRAMLPLRYRVVENRLVVTGTRIPGVPVGAVVTSIDGVPVAERLAKELRLSSGTTQWSESRAANALLVCKPGTAVRLAIELSSGDRREETLPCERPFVLASESRPDSIAELESGVWYADLTRLRASEIAQVTSKLAGARAVIFDMRGYPTDIGARILPHLMSSAEDSTDRWMHVSRIVGPFGAVADWQHMSWGLKPATPHIGGQRIFLTDGRAISYAESVMGYVRDHKLGTIVGGATAGANGNVADFAVPGGFSLVFTGMRVTRHDGHTAFHTLGVPPDVPVAPTVAGIRAGKDEVLAHALGMVRVQP